MPDYTAGDAKLRIIPDASEFKRKLEADLKKIDAHLPINVSADTAQARVDIDRFRELERRKGIQIGVETSLTQATAEMAAWRARQHANSVKVKVDADTGGALKQIEKIDDAFGSILKSVGGGLKLNLGLAGIGEIPAATLALTQMVGAIQQLAQAGLAIPGIMAGVGASFGTLALGLSGVKEAYEAVAKASDPSGSQQVQHAREVTSATNAYRNAVVDEAQAERDRTRAIKDAKFALEDLNIQLRGGKISEQQAVNNALRQRRDLQKDMMTGQIKDGLDLQQRLLDIQEADQGVVEARQRNIELQDKVSEANAKGVAGSDQVVAANERVTRSQQQVASSSDALKDAIAKPWQAANDALAQLSPNAKAFVNTLGGMHDVFKAFKDTVQDNVFAGLSDSVKTLVDADLPTLKDGMAGIATAWNGTIKALFSSLGSDSSKGLLQRILGDTGQAQAEFTKAIEPLVHGIGVLTAAGADALPRLADDIGAVADRFNAFISGADQDGRLSKWINDGITGFERIGNTLLNVGSAFSGIAKAAGGGDGFLAALERGSKAFSTFVNSTEGQNKLQKWFDEGRDEIQNHIVPLLQSLPGLFMGIVNVGTQIANVVVPPLKDIAGYLSNHKDLVKDVIGLFVTWKGISFASNIITQIGTISDAIGTLGRGSKRKGYSGGKGMLGKLGMAAALMGGLQMLEDGFAPDTGDSGDTPQPTTAGSRAGGMAANVLGDATSGGMVAGLPGAVAGGAYGLGKSIYDNANQDINAGKAKADKNWQEKHDAAPNPAPAPDQLPGQVGADLRAKIAAGQLPGYHIAPDGTVIGPDGKPVALPELSASGAPATTPALPAPVAPAPPTAPVFAPGFGGTGTGPHIPSAPGSPDPSQPNDLGSLLYWAGGPTPTSPGPLPDGGYHAVVHPEEFVQRRESVQKYGLPFHQALNAGLIDPKALPHFDGGGYIDQNGNPITPGNLPGPGVASPAYQPIAPNPTTGGVNSALGSLISSLPGPFENLTRMIPGMNGQQGGTPSGTPSLGGLWGLPAAMKMGDAGMQMWGQQASDYLGNWAGNTLAKLAGALYNGNGQGGGILGFLGLQGSILDPQNQWFQAGAKSLGIFDKLGPAFGWGTGDLSGNLQIGSETLSVGPNGSENIQVPTFATAAGYTSPSSSSGNAAHPVTPSGNLGGSPGANKALAQQIFAKFFPQSEWGAFDTLEMHEAGYNNTAKNPSSTAFGIGQFLDSTWGPYGAKTTDAAAQITYMLQYIKNRYGTPSAAWAQYYSHPGGVGWYASGGPVRGPGGPKEDKIPAWLSNDEHVFTADDVAAMGGQGNVLAFRNALHRAEGGPALLSMIMPQPNPPKPVAQIPDVQLEKPRGSAVIPSAPTKPLPAAAAPAPVAPPTAQQPTQDQQQPQQRALAPQAVSVAPAPTSLNHNLDAINTGIKSGAALAGNLASSAISAAGGMGLGGMGAGAAGQFINGLIQEGGKIATQAVNVGSSLLVGNVPGSGSSTDRASGYTMIPRQNYPDVPTGSRDTYQFYGHDTASVMQQLEIKQAQESQARLAKYGG